MDLLVAIPAFNEAANIEAVIRKVKLELPDAYIVVIDDGSKDKTAEVVRRMGINLLQLPFNLGVGGALRTAFKFAERNGFTHLVQIDADGQHDPAQVTNLINGLNNSNIVIGSRFANGKNNFATSKLRRLAMRWLSWLTSYFCKSRLTDVSSGFRISDRRAIELFAETYPTEYLGDTVESLIIAKKSGLTISEVLVEMQPRQSGEPSQNFIKSVWYLFRATLVVFLAAIHKQNEETR